MAKYYAVKVGRKPGVYNSWGECEQQVKGFQGAKFKSFSTYEEALNAVKNGWESGKKSVNVQSSNTNNVAYVEDSISVDAACSGNPGEMEYQGVDTKTGEQLFDSPLYPVGTNNLGEFLAVVDALRFLQRNNSDKIIYSDSVSAIAWVRNKKVNTNLVRDDRTEQLWNDIDAAIEWLHNNEYRNDILKWETKQWGEVKADFGRKTTSKN